MVIHSSTMQNALVEQFPHLPQMAWTYHRSRPRVINIILNGFGSLSSLWRSNPDQPGSSLVQACILLPMWSMKIKLSLPRTIEFASFQKDFLRD